MKLVIDFFSGEPWYPANPTVLNWEVGNVVGALASMGQEYRILDILDLRRPHPERALRGDMAIVIAGDRNGTRNPDFRPGSPGNLERLALAFNGYTLLCGEAARNPTEAEKRAWYAFSAVSKGECAASLLDLLSGGEPSSRRLGEGELVEIRKAIEPDRPRLVEIRVDAVRGTSVLKEAVAAAMERGFPGGILTRRRGSFNKVRELWEFSGGWAVPDFLEKHELERCPECAEPRSTSLRVALDDLDDALELLEQHDLTLNLLLVAEEKPPIECARSGRIQFVTFQDPVDQRRAHANFLDWCRRDAEEYLRSSFPVGTLLERVLVLEERGTFSQSYLLGGVPISVHVRPAVGAGGLVRARVTSHSSWILRGVKSPLKVSEATLSALVEIPGITRKKAVRILRERPFSDPDELWAILGREMSDWLSI